MATNSVLMEPVSTISTTFKSLALVTRMPSMNSGLPPSFSSVRVISGPPPWTTMGFRPAERRSPMSSQKLFFSESFTIAAPPYLMTHFLPVKREMYESASTSSEVLNLGL